MTKKNLILGGVLAILVLSAYVFNGPFAEWRKNAGKPKNFVSGFQVGDISRIEVEKNGKKMDIEKVTVAIGSSTEEKWKIAGTKDFYLSKDASDKITTSIRELLAAKLNLISENKDKKKDFEVGDGGTKVSLKKGDEVATEFIIGKMTSDYSGVFISQNNLDKIFSVKIAALNFAFSEDNLYNKTIFTTDANNINKIRFQFQGREFTLEKKGDQWLGILPKSFAVNRTKIDNIVNVMAGLTATEIPAQSFKGTGLEKHEIIVQATGAGVDNTIIVGGKNDEGLYYAKTGKSDSIYLISKENRDALNKKIEDLK
jgi:hypothetical protein